MSEKGNKSKDQNINRKKWEWQYDILKCLQWLSQGTRKIPTKQPNIRSKELEKEEQ